MKLLHLDTSILGGHSVSRKVSSAIVGRLRREIPGVEVRYRDLAAVPLSHLSGAHLAAAQGAAGDAPSDSALGQEVLEEFLAADIVVIGAPMYNFSIPSQLKAWIDRILVAGKTFSYTAHGVEGLARGKRVIIAVSRGGHYGPEMPSFAAEHVETYLRAVFGFIGIEPEIIVAEGVQVGPEQRDKALSEALQAAAQVRAA